MSSDPRPGSAPGPPSFQRPASDRARIDEPPEVAEAARRPGARFGRYVLLNEIGQGGMGAVFRAWDPQIRRIVAVKVLGVRPGILAEDVERFAREAHAAGRLRHPGVIAIHDVGHHDHDPFIVMDFVAGTTLRALLVERRPARQVLSLVREVALALDHAHARGVVHRDVKPANVLIDEDGRPILTDFGLAGDSSARERLTTTGSTLGTPAYMSPEQVEGRPERVGPPTDVWALGVILYEATCGRAPYHGPSVTDVFAKILLDEPETPRRVVPEMAPELEALIMRCLARDPARRPTARGLASAVDALLARSGELAPALAAAPAAGAGPGFTPAPGSGPVAESFERTEIDSRPPRPASSRAPARPETRGASRAAAIAIGVGLIGIVLAGIALALTGGGGGASAGRVGLTAPADGAWVRSRRFAVEGTVAQDAGLDAVWVGVAGGPPPRGVPIAEGRFAGAIELPADAADAAIHRLVVSAAPGGPPLATATVRVDELAPVIEAVVETDESGAARLRGRVSEAHLRSLATDAGETVPVDVNGAFALRVDAATTTVVGLIATDAAGNRTRHEVRIAGRLAGARPIAPWWEPHPEQVAFAERTGLPLAVENELGMRFCLIPPGAFRVGDEDAGGYREAELSRGFYLGATEVTNAAFRRWEGSAASARRDRGDYAWERKDWRLDGADQPVVWVGWKAARAYCAWLDERAGGDAVHRLPTELQWERACRAGTRTRYFWGDGDADGVLYANANDAVTDRERTEPRRSYFPGDDRHRASAPVGSFRPNGFGLHDMAGNVSELMDDGFVADRPRERLLDWRGPDPWNERRKLFLEAAISRGGAFSSVPLGCRSGYREKFDYPIDGRRYLGFRVLRELPPE